MNQANSISGRPKTPLSLMDLPIDVLRLVIRKAVEFDAARTDNLVRMLRLRQINSALAGSPNPILLSVPSGRRTAIF